MGCGIVFDVGTTAVKTMVFNRHFVVEDSVSVEYRLLAPEKGNRSASKPNFTSCTESEGKKPLPSER